MNDDSYLPFGTAQVSEPAVPISTLLPMPWLKKELGPAMSTTSVAWKDSQALVTASIQ